MPNTNDGIFLNTLVSREDEMALRIIGGFMRLNRSEMVRLAIHDFIEKHKDVVQVTSLPRPKGGQFVPVVSVSDDARGDDGTEPG